MLALEFFGAGFFLRAQTSADKLQVEGALKGVDKGIRSGIPANRAAQNRFNRGGALEQSLGSRLTGGFIRKNKGLGNTRQVTVERQGSVLEHAFLAAGLGRPRSYGVCVREPSGDVPARQTTRVSGPSSGGDWRRGRERIVHPARACADSDV